MDKIKAGIVGGSGYTGGELIRLLLFHPEIEIKTVTSEHNDGKFVSKLHPNLRQLTKIKYTSVNSLGDNELDILFLCLPHGESGKKIDYFKTKCHKIIDLSADFRLKDSIMYETYYKSVHPRPELLNKFIYGIPELHREEMKTADYISSAGCNATASILALYPLFKENLLDLNQTVIDIKNGSSEAGNQSNEGSHHPERSGVVRSYSPTGHRHGAEVLQELSFGKELKIHFSATTIDMVRGVLATCHTFLNEKVEEKDIWKIFRKYYENEPFIRIVKEKDWIYRLPEPKILAGTNYCDIGFELDPSTNRLVVISAIDNLMKGAAGQALQACNIMFGFPETTGLTFPGLHPI
jgi:N-acetyl-gamma-glutamyl-phosphate/LysW-gamma-L-alpha-aminoadipyl-6-phosphate reductase